MISKEDWQQWFASDLTKKYFELLQKDADGNLEDMLNITSTGENLSKDFHTRRGYSLGMLNAYATAKELASSESSAK